MGEFAAEAGDTSIATLLHVLPPSRTYSRHKLLPSKGERPQGRLSLLEFAAGFASFVRG